MSNQINLTQDLPFPKAMHTGFTSFQLVLTIIIIAIIVVVAMPKMQNLEHDAHIASVKATAGALKSGIDEARYVYLVKVGQGQVDDLLVFLNNAPLDSNHPYEQLGMLDFNSYGWPVQNFNIPDPDQILLNNVHDCVSLWRTVLRGSIPSVSLEGTPDKTDYKASYGGSVSGVASQRCRYSYRKSPTLFISYSAVTGKVSSSAQPN